MTLREIEAHCEKHEARADSYNASVDKLTKDGSGESPKKIPESDAGTGASSGKIVAITVVIIIAIAAAFLYVQLAPKSGNNGTNEPPRIDSLSFENGPNGLRLWSNASDSDDSILSITIVVYRDLTPMGDPVLERTYWFNQSSANITDVIIPGVLPPGDYLLTAYATDLLGKESALSGFQRFTLPV